MISEDYVAVRVGPTYAKRTIHIVRFSSLPSMSLQRDATVLKRLLPHLPKNDPPRWLKNLPPFTQSSLFTFDESSFVVKILPEIFIDIFPVLSPEGIKNPLRFSRRRLHPAIFIL